MQSSRAFKRSTLRGALLAAALLFSSAALAGPPLLCHPFDTAGAASLPWGGGWNRIDTRYDTARLSADTLRLLATDTPVIARMETLRRAAIYASADGAHVRDLAMKLDTRITAAGTPQAKALAKARLRGLVQDAERSVSRARGRGRCGASWRAARPRTGRPTRRGPARPPAPTRDTRRARRTVGRPSSPPRSA